MNRYVVETGSAHTVIYDGDNYEIAVRVTNFWDERQDTWLIDNVAGTVNGDHLNALETAMLKFDALERKLGLCSPKYYRGSSPSSIWKKCGSYA